MGRQHALTALLAGVGVAACVPSAPWPVRGLVVVVTGGAGLLPDLDHRQATAARSLGLLTKLLARGVDRVSLAVYYATRSPRDPGDRQSGHRLFTHTVPGCLLAGALMGLLTLVSPVAAAVSCGLLGGLLALGFKQAGFGLAVSCTAVSWWTVSEYPGWSWLFPVAVTVGCLVHVAGDSVTNSGVPLLWPLARDGRRWQMVTTPVTFSAGDHVETVLVAPLLLFGLLASGAMITGIGPAVASAVSSAGGS